MRGRIHSVSLLDKGGVTSVNDEGQWTEAITARSVRAHVGRLSDRDERRLGVGGSSTTITARVLADACVVLVGPDVQVDPKTRVEISDSKIDSELHGIYRIERISRTRSHRRLICLKSEPSS